MDPVSHLLFARMLAALREERAATTPALVAATTLGGLAPDVDVALVARGWDVYLRWHAAGTHSIVGTLVVALGTAALVHRYARGTPWPDLIVAAWIGALSHVFFDLVSGAVVQPFWPLWSWSASAPIVAMADPLAIACLLVGALAMYVWPRVPRSAAALTLALLALLFGVKLTTRAWATDAYAQTTAAAGRAAQTTIEAVWGSWREWSYVDRTPDGLVRAWRVDGWSGETTLRFAQETRRGADFARRSQRQFATARNFADAHPYAFATLSPRERGAVVFWSDARFCWNAREDADPQAGVPHQDVRPPDAPVRCAMWFGGSLDEGGVPIEALVWLGGHLQRRAP